MVFLEYFVGARVRHVHHAVAVFVREGQAGVAEVVAYGVFITQGTAVVVYPAFGVVHCFEYRAPGSSVAVLNSIDIFLPVLEHAAVGYGFAQFAAGGVVQHIDGFRAAAERHLAGQIQKIIGHVHALVRIGTHVAVGVVGVLGGRDRAGDIVPAVHFSSRGCGVGYFLEFVGTCIIGAGQVVDLIDGETGARRRVSVAVEGQYVTPGVVREVFAVGIAAVRRAGVGDVGIGGSQQAVKVVVGQAVTLALTAPGAPDHLADVAVFLGRAAQSAY